MPKLSAIKSIGLELLEKFRKIKIETVEELLKHGATPAGRKEISGEVGIEPGEVLQLVRYADLMRVGTLESQVAVALVAAGVLSVGQLAQHGPEVLLRRLLEIQKELNLSNLKLTAKKVAVWIEKAKKLDPDIVVVYPPEKVEDPDKPKEDGPACWKCQPAICYPCTPCYCQVCHPPYYASPCGYFYVPTWVYVYYY